MALGKAPKVGYTQDSTQQQRLRETKHLLHKPYIAFLACANVVASVCDSYTEREGAGAQLLAEIHPPSDVGSPQTNEEREANDQGAECRHDASATDGTLRIPKFVSTEPNDTQKGPKFQKMLPLWGFGK